jgi:hypothetical protein
MAKMHIGEGYHHDDCDPMPYYYLEMNMRGKRSTRTFYPNYEDESETMESLRIWVKRYGKTFMRRNTARLIKKRGYQHTRKQYIHKDYDDDEIPF